MNRELALAVRPLRRREFKQESIQRAAEANLPSRFGKFRIVVFTGDPQGKEHLALVHGNVRGAHDVPVRIHSECLTGDVLGSLRCDCRDQLIASLRAIGRRRRGVALYLRQEGRGIGLTNKIRAYALQDRGHDTFEADRLLGFREDQRDYAVGAQMLHALGIRSVRLMTNSPAKLQALIENGTQVTGRIPVLAPVNPHNAGYLEAKRRRAGHWLRRSRMGPGGVVPGSEAPAGEAPGAH